MTNAENIWTDAGQYNAELMCCLISIELTESGIVTINVPEGHHTHMSGAIRIAESLSWDVHHIFIFSGRNIDIIYLLEDGKWMARLPVHQQIGVTEATEWPDILHEH